jgi:hypothetical protein
VRLFPTLSFFGVLVWAFAATASPIPAAGTSELTSSLKNYQFYRKGFELNFKDTRWSGRSLPSRHNEINVTFLDPSTSPKAKISVQTESLAEALPVEAYAKKWLKDYQAYGFEVLGAKPFAENKTKGYLVDLFFRKEKQQERQAIFVKNRTVVTITCSDLESHFAMTLNPCNELLKSFRWLQP